MSVIERDNEASVAEAPLPPVEAPAPLNVPAAGTASGKATDNDREYVVLVNEVGSDTRLDLWARVAEIKAISAEQAVRKAVELPGTSFLNPDGATTLVAVPSRSWNPVSVTVKVETSIVLS